MKMILVSSVKFHILPAQGMSSLILYDDFNNLFHCNYVNHDNQDKLPLCFIEYVNPNDQSLPATGTILHYYNNINGIIQFLN